LGDALPTPAQREASGGYGAGRTHGGAAARAGAGAGCGRCTMTSGGVRRRAAHVTIEVFPGLLSGFAVLALGGARGVFD